MDANARKSKAARPRGFKESRNGRILKPSREALAGRPA